MTSESQLQHSLKMQSLGTLAGGVAHDINNVLGTILGIASIILETESIEAANRRRIEIIFSAAKQGGELVKSVLAFARRGPAEEKVLNLKSIIQDEVRLLEHTTLARITITTDIADDLHFVCGDETAISTTLMNLCINGLDAMPNGGTLTIRAKNVDMEWVEIQVEDSGTGMPDHIIQKALDPFFTTKDPGKGTGLGLALVYNTMTSHGGRVELRSDQGVGTCVSLHFPTTRNALPGSTDHCRTAIEKPHIPKNILIVDDDDLIRHTIVCLVESLGHNAFHVSNGKLALTALKKDIRPDLVLLNMNMPVLNGARTLLILRETHPVLPVIISTGKVDQAVLDLREQIPNVTILAKPFSRLDLSTVIKDIFETKMTTF